MDRIQTARDLTLILLEMNAWDEGSFGESVRMAWKGFDFEDLNALEECGYTYGSRRSKSVVITEEGRRRARELMEQYGIEPDPIPEKQRFFRLLLRFDFEKLNCMRTLLVPEHTTFEDFHTMIQSCLNWMNYHLYDFRLAHNGQKYYISWPDYDTGGDPRLDFGDGEREREVWLSANDAYLDDFFPKTKEAVYSYDYGDGWEIRVSLLNPHEKLASNAPICWEGAGDAPPEDVGGEDGFERFLAALEDEGDPDHDRLEAWGEGQGFEPFSKIRANDRLRHWHDWARKE